MPQFRAAPVKLGVLWLTELSRTDKLKKLYLWKGVLAHRRARSPRPEEERFMIRTTRPPVRVGIVGLGRVGLEAHLPEMMLKPELFTVIAVCLSVRPRTY